MSEKITHHPQLRETGSPNRSIFNAPAFLDPLPVQPGVVVPSGTPAREALARLRENAKGIIIVDENRIVGAVTLHSMLDALDADGALPPGLPAEACISPACRMLREDTPRAEVLAALSAGAGDDPFLVMRGGTPTGFLDKSAFLDRVVKRLHLRVGDIPGAARKGRLATVAPTISIYGVLRRLRSGAELVAVVEDGRPTGVLTPGDISRLVADGCDIWSTPAGQVMSLPVVTADAGTSAQDALELLAAHAIGSLVVTDRAGRAAGMLTVEDLGRAFDDPRAERLEEIVRAQEARLERSLRNLSARSLYFDTVLSSTLKAGVVGTDRKLRIIHLNSAARAFLGNGSAPKAGQDLRTLPYFRALDSGVLRAALRRALNGEEHVFTFDQTDDDARHGADDGPEDVPALQCRIAAVRERDRPIGFVVTLQDLGEQRAAENTIRRLAYYDSLTELPNRVLFFERLGTELRHARRRHEILAVMLLDLNDFKSINDRYGHLFGDKFLRAVGGRLLSALRDSDTVARLGGDEFTFILPDIADRANAALIAQKLLTELQRPFDIEGVRIESAGSIGIALFPEDGSTPETLLGLADTDMYRHKRRTKTADDERAHASAPPRTDRFTS